MKASRFLAVLAILACSAFSACGQLAEPPAGSARTAVTSELDSVPGPGLTSILQSKINAFALALQTGDAATLVDLLSSEVLDRIATRGPGKTFDESLAAFMRSERQMLAQELGDITKAPDGFLIQSLESLPGDSIAVSLSFDGRALPKPFYFVTENGEHKVNVLPPEYGLLGSSGYLVENRDYVLQQFRCSYYGPYQIAPASGTYYPTLKISCWNSCGFWGTEFSTALGPNTCAYNLWGVDMRIMNGAAICTSRC